MPLSHPDACFVLGLENLKIWYVHTRVHANPEDSPQAPWLCRGCLGIVGICVEEWYYHFHMVAEP